MGGTSLWEQIPAPAASPPGQIGWIHLIWASQTPQSAWFQCCKNTSKAGWGCSGRSSLCWSVPKAATGTCLRNSHFNCPHSPIPLQLPGLALRHCLVHLLLILWFVQCQYCNMLAVQGELMCAGIYFLIRKQQHWSWHSSHRASMDLDLWLPIPSNSQGIFQVLALHWALWSYLCSSSSVMSSSSLFS